MLSSTAPPRCSAIAPTGPGDEPNLNTCPICLWFPGAMPRFSQQALEKASLLCLGLNCEHPGAKRLRPEGLLLSRPAQGIPVVPGPSAAGQKRLARHYRRGRQAQSASHPSYPHGGGCGQAGARNGRTPAHQSGGFQPRRRAAGGNRHRAGLAQPPRGHGVPPGSADPDALYRHAPSAAWKQAPCASTPISPSGRGEPTS